VLLTDVTYKNPLLGLKAISVGSVPTDSIIVATTVFVAGFITETELLLLLAVYINPLLGLKAISNGWLEAGSIMVATTVFVAGFITHMAENPRILRHACIFKPKLHKAPFP
jgi:hypothetical protein